MSSATNIPPIDTEQDRPSVDERRALIERVAASEHFRRSARLRDFLLYVGHESLKEGHHDINEQEVGAKVFGRSATYDRSQDNIVRVNATELRKRIDTYFATEGIHEPLVLEIPRGGYKPVFHRRVPHGEEAQSASAANPVPVLVEGETKVTTIADAPRFAIHIVWALLVVGLAVVSLVLYQQNRSMRIASNAWEGKPAVASFWTDFLRYQRQTDIVLPDDSLSLIEDLVHHPISLGDYLNRTFMGQIQQSALSADRKSDLDQVFAHNLVTFGGVRSAQQVTAQIPSSFATNLTLSRYYVADAIKRNNVILIGGKKANPWVYLFDDKMNFSLDYDYQHGQAFIANRHPRPGEQTAYSGTMDPNALVGYSVVAYLPNPSHTGNAIVLAGSDSDATDAAAEFLTSEEKMEAFRNALHAKTVPYFEILLKTSRLSGTSFSAEMLAYRTY
jgi:hypothetical protein